MAADFIFGSDFLLSCGFILRLSILGFQDFGQILIFEVLKNIHELVWVVEINLLIVEVIWYIDKILLESFFKLLRPIFIGHIVISLIDSAVFGFSTTSFICQIEIIVSKLVFVELVELDPVVFNLLELLGSLLSLILNPIFIFFLKNGVEEFFVLFQSVESINILINIRFKILNLTFELVDFGLGSFSFTLGFISSLVSLICGHVVALNKLNELGTIFVELGGRILQGVSFTILFQIKIFNFFFYGIVT